jgi:hypothetical protein
LQWRSLHVLVVVSRLEPVDESSLKAATLLAICRCVGHKIEITATVTCGFERISGTTEVSLPQIVAFANSQWLLFTICLDVHARPAAKRFAGRDETWESLEREGERHQV